MRFVKLVSTKIAVTVADGLENIISRHTHRIFPHIL
jgi:hypothetical protein